ncbi:MAG: oligogalacturonate lyase family protein [Chloroflexales bacterium]|nr:oligogalacturonate lyase family protein [Chloroflexales bacterium]
MCNQHWPSEMRTFQDERTGRTIQQLTNQGNNVHLYFTENAFDTSGAFIIFRSDRASGEQKAPYDDPHYNLFKLSLDNGEIIQLTDESHPVESVTKTPDSQLIVYSTGNQIKALDLNSGAARVVYAETGDFDVGAPSISHNRRYIAFARNERVPIQRGPNYAGFKEHFYTIKDGRITIAYLDGSGAFDAYRDTHWLGHFQFCPDDSTLAMFCHEGPWHLVTQRIWLLDFVSRSAKPCFRQREEDSIGHEFWTNDGYIFFDNRGPEHDGAITSDRTQAVVTAPNVNANAMLPFVGLADRHRNVVRRLDMPYYCNHYHAGPNQNLLVGDDVDTLVLIDTTDDAPPIETLCYHGTSWHTQSSHCHPTWSWDGRQILYASDRGGQVNLYLLEM